MLTNGFGFRYENGNRSVYELVLYIINQRIYFDIVDKFFFFDR